MASELGEARIIGPKDGEYAGTPGVLHDRFLIDARETGGRFAVVEHLLPPRTLAAPLHRHHLEDEFSFVLEGTVGALLGEDEVVGAAGVLIFKPRGQWHTFWNAGDAPARILEIISPGGFEQAFRDLDALGGELSSSSARRRSGAAGSRRRTRIVGAGCSSGRCRSRSLPMPSTRGAR